jgi:hypothetical protein
LLAWAVLRQAHARAAGRIPELSFSAVLLEYDILTDNAGASMRVENVAFAALIKCAFTNTSLIVPSGVFWASLFDAEAPTCCEVPVEECIDAEFRFTFERTGVRVEHEFVVGSSLWSASALLGFSVIVVSLAAIRNAGAVDRVEEASTTVDVVAAT